MRFNMLQIILVLVVMALLTACATEPSVELPLHTKLAECAKIADRGERQRCLDDAYRAGNRSQVGE
jgi:uncharacterized lipoprotein YmbA